MNKMEGREAAVGREEYKQALEEAATQMGTVGPRIFRELKTRLMRSEQIPRHVRDLGDSQMWVLHNLAHGRQTSSELAARHHVTNPTMTRIVDSLVRGGYVQRHHDADDRRCIFLELTEEGKDLGGVVKRHFRDALLELLSPLSEEQLADIVRAYQHLGTLLPVQSGEPEGHRQRRSQTSTPGTPGTPGTRGRRGTFGRLHHR